jgi:hypothetical protein
MLYGLFSKMAYLLMLDTCHCGVVVESRERGGVHGKVGGKGGWLKLERRIQICHFNLGIGTIPVHERKQPTEHPPTNTPNPFQSRDERLSHHGERTEHQEERSSTESFLDLEHSSPNECFLSE